MLNRGMTAIALCGDCWSPFVGGIYEIDNSDTLIRRIADNPNSV